MAKRSFKGLQIKNMCLNKFWKLIIFLTLLSSPLDLLAAPFCTVLSYGKNCFYYDYNSCLQAAGSSGACVVNQDEVRTPSSGAPFCVVASYGAQCFYYDAQSCRQAASSQNAVCVVNPNR
jgi:hypothetical protein